MFVSAAEFTASFPTLAAWSKVNDQSNADVQWRVVRGTLLPQAEAIIQKVPQNLWADLYEEDGDPETDARLAKLTGLTESEIRTLLRAGRVVGGA